MKGKRFTKIDLPKGLPQTWREEETEEERRQKEANKTCHKQNRKEGNTEVKKTKVSFFSQEVQEV